MADQCRDRAEGALPASRSGEYGVQGTQFRDVRRGNSQSVSFHHFDGRGVDPGRSSYARRIAR